MALTVCARRQGIGRPWGFTLAELLISLAILGVIAVFTVPKVLHGQQQSQKKAVFKETLAALSQLTYHEYQRPRYKNAGTGRINQDLWFGGELNVVKQCTGDASAEGCWHAPVTDVLMNHGGVTLHNGSEISGLAHDRTWNDPGNCIAVYVDWNGAAPPNLVGNDILRLLLNINTEICNSGDGTARPGTIAPSSQGSLHRNLFNEVFN